MKKRINLNSISDQLLYVPNRKEGQSLFNGEAKPSNEVKELIGEEGIQYIKGRIASIIENRKEMFGNETPEFYGLNYLQKFYDLKNRVLIKVRDCIEIDSKEDKIPLSSFPKIITTPKYDQRMSLIHDYEMHIETTYLPHLSNIKAYNFIKSGKLAQWDYDLPDY